MFSVSLYPCPGMEYTFEGTVLGNYRYYDKTIKLDFEIRINIGRNYPMEYPFVYMLDRGQVIVPPLQEHVFKGGALCLGVLPEIYSVLYKDASLSNLMTKLILPYLLGMKYKMMFGLYPFGEQLHGKTGIVEYFNKTYGLDTVDKIIGFLSMVRLKPRLANKILCPFGCNAEYGHCLCHGNITSLQKVLPPKLCEMIINQLVC